MRKVPTNHMLDDLRSVGRKLMHPPTRQEYGLHGNYAANTLVNRFGSWLKALHKAGWDVHRPGRHVSSEELIEDLSKAGNYLGHPPTNKEYTQFGRFNATTLIERFGSWQNAMAEAGWNIKSSAPISSSAVVEEILEIANKLGRTPSRDEFDQLSNISRGPAIRIFGSWNAALNAAGLLPTRLMNMSGEQLIEELHRVARVRGRRPKYSDFSKTSDAKYSAGPFTRVFGSFSAALKAAGFKASTEKNISKKKLLEELARVAKLLGHAPTLKDFDQYGIYGTATYVRRFGTWNGALTVGGWEPHLGRGVAVIAEDGREYDSFGEAEVANILYESQNQGVILSYTPKVFISEDRKWTSDFMVVLVSGKIYYIEYDGFGSKRPNGGYDKLIPKLKFYKDKAITLVIVSPQDYMPAYGVLKSIEELHSLFFKTSGAVISPLKVRRRTPAMLLDELIRVAKEIGYSPSKHEFGHHSEYSTTQYLSIWGSWNNALKAAGIVPKKMRDIPRSELLEDLKKLSKNLGRSPRAEDVRSGNFSPSTYQRRFGTFNKALREAGLTPNKVGKATNEELLISLTELTKRLNRIPTKTEMDKYGSFSGALFTNHFGSWKNALRIAGLNSSDKKAR